MSRTFCNLESICDYCTLYNDETTWSCPVYDNPDYNGISKCDDCYMSFNNGCCWKFSNLSAIEMIHMLQKDNADDIINRCNIAVTRFYEIVSQNIAPVGSDFNSDEITALRNIGCDVKMYIATLLDSNEYGVEFDLEKMVKTASVDTNLYYWNIHGCRDNTLICKYFNANRFDVLDDLHTKNALVDYSSRLAGLFLDSFADQKLPITDDVVSRMTKYCGTDKVISYIINRNMRNLDAYLYNTALANPRSSVAKFIVNFNNFPSSLQHLECGQSNKMNYNIQVPASIDKLYITPRWCDSKITENDIATYFASSNMVPTLSTVTKHIIPDTDTRRQIIKDVLTKNNNFDTMMHFEPNLANFTHYKSLEFMA